MRRLKQILLLFFLICSLQAKDLVPSQKLSISGAATDMVLDDNNIYISTAKGSVEIFDLKGLKKESVIKVPKIKDFVGDVIESKLYSVDVLKNKILIVSQGEKGGRNIFLFNENKLINLISATKKLYIARAKFIDENTIIFATLSNQLYLYDLITQKYLYTEQISQSKFSYFVLNETKESILVADESGDLKVVTLKNGQIEATLSNQNLDNVFQVDWKKGSILTAGQDRRSVLYNKSSLQPYIRKSRFLIYGCALNQTATLAAYSSDEQNNVTVYETQSKRDLYRLIDNEMTISKILFLDKSRLLIGSDAHKVNLYELR